MEDWGLLTSNSVESPFMKNVLDALNRTVGWTGKNISHWSKYYGRARTNIPDYTLVWRLYQIN